MIFFNIETKDYLSILIGLIVRSLNTKSNWLESRVNFRLLRIWLGSCIVVIDSIYNNVVSGLFDIFIVLYFDGEDKIVARTNWRWTLWSRNCLFCVVVQWIFFMELGIKGIWSLTSYLCHRGVTVFGDHNQDLCSVLVQIAYKFYLNSDIIGLVCFEIWLGQGATQYRLWWERWLRPKHFS